MSYVVQTKDGRILTGLIAEQNPNGITLSPDEKTLYLTAKDGVFKYAVAADGSPGTAEKFGSGVVSSGDGMVVDCAATAASTGY